MKKLMIAAAIVCAATLSQAATVNWSVSNVNTGSPQKDWQVMAFYTAQGAGSDAIIAAINNGTAASLDGYFEGKPLAIGFGKGKVAAHDVSVAALDTAKKYDFYFVVFNDEDATQATKYLIGSAPGIEYSPLKENFAPSYDFDGATWNDITGPEPVPEPTSGLLLLLGVAGLALRRKQA